ncbi:MAG: (2Fe-2S)-binding protein [Gammaproteobacteria bacterium]|nr:(2Fe-2S)-binding protein [Gammaproteobacteria bacterium]MBU1477295.1 (2Fe-2S)-binding protein [Gammaproteobacteria bacterium]MBU2000526.1 (2Fe-2S)-binding protein [Gammaproteobacteria bacterium]MBU2133349.1 (2Fe-2S)-binding protein [Gammaproteobacteria bacterium]MBU2188347.1 (2Fe-2S)-binding protein [Gammaproteobacteria bacterium]
MASQRGDTRLQLLRETSPSYDALNHTILTLNQLLHERAPFYGEHFSATTSPTGLSFDEWSSTDTYQTLLARFAIAHPSAETQSETETVTEAETEATKTAANSRAHAFASKSALVSKSATASRKDTRKALHSLWGQWYFGLLVPPVMEWIFNAPQTDLESIHWQPQSIFMQVHTSGRVAKFECNIAKHQPNTALTFKKYHGIEPLCQTNTKSSFKTDIEVHSPLTSYKPPVDKELALQGLILNLLQPSVERLLTLSPVPAKLYWSHLGYLIHWYLGELGLTEQHSQQLKQALFRCTTFLDGSTNPLYNSINLLIEPEQSSADSSKDSSVKKSATLSSKTSPKIHCIRRTCCLRYQLANTGQCHDCPLLSRAKVNVNAAKQT